MSKDAYYEYLDKNGHLATKWLIDKFDRIAPYEEKIGKDLCNFSTEDLLSYYKMLSSGSLDTLMVINNVYSNYIDWCITNGLVKNSRNVAREISNEMLNGCLSDAVVFTREEILNICKNAPEPADAFMLLALFEGIKGKAYCDIMNARKNQLDGDIWTTYSKQKIKISSELKGYFIEACDYYDRGNSEPYDLNDDRAMKLTVNHLSNHSLNNDAIMLQRIRRRFDALKDYPSFGLNGACLGDIWESGRIDTIKRLRRGDEPVRDTILRESDAINKYGKLSSVTRWIIRYGEKV